MTNLTEYQKDGANFQAKAVLCFLQTMSIEESWNKEFKCYDAEFKIGRWENCREQGYVISLRAGQLGKIKQLNIAFFEHRNSDNICAIKWEQMTINTPTIDTAKFGEVYKTKYDTSHSVSYGEVVPMANWIEDEFKTFWLANSLKTISHE